VKVLKVLDGGDARDHGLGIITEPRWKGLHDYMVSSCWPTRGGLEGGFHGPLRQDLKLSM